MSQLDVTFTPAADEYIKKVLAKGNGTGFRLSVKKTGCSGYSYLPTVVEQGNSTDITFTLPSGVVIFIDATWSHLLDGVQVDYVEEDKAGIKQKRLVFTNAKETGRCGCGESFHLE